MYKTLTIFILSFFVGFFSYAQNPQLSFVKDFRNTDHYYSTAVGDQFGNTIVAGRGSGHLPFSPITFQTGVHFVIKLDTLGQYQWIKIIGSNMPDGGVVLTVDDEGNCYVSGKFRDSIDLDGGSGVHMVYSKYDGQYIMKLDPHGDLIWGGVIRRAHGAVFSRIDNYALAVDQNQNLFVTGRYYGAFDFDPGPDSIIHITDTFDYYNLFLLKLDSSGSYGFLNSIKGNTGGVIGVDVEVDGNQDILLAGNYSDSLDLDPGPGQHIIPNENGDLEYFLAKYSNNGGFIWAKHSHGQGRPHIVDIETNQFNEITISGIIRGEVFFSNDPGSPFGNPVGINNDDLFVAQFDPFGNINWGKSYGGPCLDRLGKISTDPFGDIFSFGTFSCDSADFDPGIGTHILKNASGETDDFDAFVQKLDRNGNFIWARSVGSKKLSYDDFWDGFVNNRNEITAFGRTADTLDIDFGPGEFLVGDGNFIVRWRDDSCSQSAFSYSVDSLLQLTCQNPGYISISPVGGNPPFTFNWGTNPPQTGSSIIIDSPGHYPFYMVDSSGCFRSTTFIMDGPSDLVNHDLDVELSHTGPVNGFRPGFPAFLEVEAINTGCDPFTGMLYLTSPSSLTLDSTDLTPFVSGIDTIGWLFDQLQYDSGSFLREVFFTVDTQSTVGSQLCFDVYIKPAALDNDTTYIIKQYCFPVVNSYDPNDIQVYPVGACEENYVLQNQELTYTVRFQNEGTASAINVVIFDTLDSSFDLESIDIVSHSHEPLIAEIISTNVLRLSFPNINLDFKDNNEEKSKGFVKFRISPRLNIPVGRKVENRAGIVFDFNEPIMTNMVQNTFVNVIPELNFRIENIQNVLSVNPADGEFQWYDCSGELVKLEGENGSSFLSFDGGYYKVLVKKEGCSKYSNCVYLPSAFEKKDLFQVYPNPSPGKFEIFADSSISEFSFEISDLAGNLFLSGTYSNTQKVELSLKEKPGIYLIRIYFEGQKLYKKLILH